MLRKRFILILFLILILALGSLALAGCGSPPDDEVEDFQEQLEDFDEEDLDDSFLDNENNNDNSS